MTLWDTLSALRRRWYVVVAGLLCMTIALVLIHQQKPVYFSRTSVYFLAPASTLYPNVLRTTSLDIVATAGVVAKLINGTAEQTKVASTEVTLVGRGVRDGSSIALPDNGGQWSVSYNVQALDIQVVAPTAEEVRARQSAIIAEINEKLTDLQNQANVSADDRITTEVLPPAPPVDAYGGRPRFAEGMTVALGVALTLLAVGTVELRSRRRQLASSTAAGSSAHPEAEA